MAACSSGERSRASVGRALDSVSLSFDSSMSAEKPNPQRGIYRFCNAFLCNCKAFNNRVLWRCDCGEDSNQDLAWQWSAAHSSQSVSLEHSGLYVVCQKGRSRGTALLMADEPLTAGWHYFWEIKILTGLYGADTMVGVCSERVHPEVAADRFVGLLGGCDWPELEGRPAWGYSCRGFKRHGGASQKYGVEFGKGSVVGVYANMRNGSLEFFLNRQSLGVAYRGLLGAGGALRPAFSTSAADVYVRLITAVSVPDSLQLQATAVVNKRLPIWPLVLPAPLCRVVRRFPWLEYPLHASCQPVHQVHWVVVESPDEDSHTELSPHSSTACSARRRRPRGRVGGSHMLDLSSEDGSSPEFRSCLAVSRATVRAQPSAGKSVGARRFRLEDSEDDSTAEEEACSSRRETASRLVVRVLPDKKSKTRKPSAKLSGAVGCVKKRGESKLIAKRERQVVTASVNTEPRVAGEQSNENAIPPSARVGSSDVKPKHIAATAAAATRESSMRSVHGKPDQHRAKGAGSRRCILESAVNRGADRSAR